MCGICGYAGTDLSAIIPEMCASMAHRGPDDEGAWYDPDAQVGLGHRRLSIIDVSPAGHQPMSNEDGSIWISCDGEIYDFQQHREELTRRGHRFRSATDTEVIIHLYEEKGPEFLNELNGMFALAIWDRNKRQLLLARDHAGIKPLYYWASRGGLVFASELKALLRVPGIPRELNHRRIADLLTLLWVPGRETLLRGVEKLMPGHLLLWRDGAVTLKRWFSMSYLPDNSVSEREWVERVRETFVQAVRRQMVSDVPVGVLLSGGLDSSSILAGVRRSCPGREINCYTARIHADDNTRDRFVDDYPYARRVADVLGVNLKSFVLKPDVVSTLPKMVYHMDEPDADPAVFPAYLIAKAAREDATKVLLSGTGGDEMFFGYNSHLAYRLYERYGWIPRWVSGPLLAAAQAGCSRLFGAQSRPARRLRRFRKGLRSRGLGRHMALVDWADPSDRLALYTPALAERLELPEEPPPGMAECFAAFEGSGGLNRHSDVLIQTFLAAHNFLYADKSSMAVGVEVRVPFLDVELMRLCSRIPETLKLRGTTTKYVLKKSMETYLPAQVLSRPKTGFVAPLRKWIAQDFSPLIEDLLSPERLRSRGLFEPAAVRRMVAENRRNKADHAYLIYALLVLEVWLQTFLDRPGQQVRP